MAKILFFDKANKMYKLPERWIEYKIQIAK